MPPVAAEALHAAVYGETTIIVSASQRQASELLRKASQLLPLVTVAAEGVVEVDKQSAEAIELSTGGRVQSLPAAAATVQGYTGHVVIDEAAWIPDIETLWMAVVPTISTRKEYRVSVISTPGPREGMFYRLWNGADSAWSRHRIDVYDAKTGGAPHDIKALRAAVADEATSHPGRRAAMLTAGRRLPWRSTPARCSPAGRSNARAMAIGATVSMDFSSPAIGGGPVNTVCY